MNASLFQSSMSKPTRDQRVFVVIVNWNGKKDTLACLRSLATIDCKNVHLRVILVDNGSSDQSVSVISEKYPDVHIIAAGRNLGFTGGNNVGIRYALDNSADFIWLLNNDTVVEKHVLSFLPVFEDRGVAACGSKIYFAPGREFHYDRYLPADRGKVIWYAGGQVDWDNMYASHRGVDEVDHGQYDKIESTSFITGCSLVVRADIVRKIGMLDDRYYLYLEDLDWCLRMKKAGYRIIYVPSSSLWHVNAGSSGRPGNPLHEYYFTRNRLILGFKYAPIRTRFALIREAIRFFFGNSPIRKKAVLDAIFGRLGKQYEPQIIR